MSRQSPTLDETDLAILEQIEIDFDARLEILTEKFGLPKSAVHYQHKKLKDDEVIQGITIDVDPLALGLEMTAITDIMVAHESGYLKDIGEKTRGT